MSGLSAGAILGLIYGPVKRSKTIIHVTDKEVNQSNILNQKSDHSLEIIAKKIDQVSEDISSTIKSVNMHAKEWRIGLKKIELKLNYK